MLLSLSPPPSPFLLLFSPPSSLHQSPLRTLPWKHYCLSLPEFSCVLFIQRNHWILPRFPSHSTIAWKFSPFCYFGKLQGSFHSFVFLCSGMALLSVSQCFIPNVFTPSCLRQESKSGHCPFIWAGSRTVTGTVVSVSNPPVWRIKRPSQTLSLSLIHICTKHLVPLSSVKLSLYNKIMHRPPVIVDYNGSKQEKGKSSLTWVKKLLGCIFVCSFIHSFICRWHTGFNLPHLHFGLNHFFTFVPLYYTFDLGQ